MRIRRATAQDAPETEKVRAARNVGVAVGGARSMVIRTPDQRLRVFVSSTLGELAPERTVVRQAVERLRLIPVMFELGARPHPPAQLYRAYLDQSQVFIGIYWQRYGWVAPDATVSGLEDEFLLSKGMPRLMYIKEPSSLREERLAELVARLTDEADSSYRRFATADELGELVEGDLAILLSERFEASDNGRLAAQTPQRSAPPALPVPLTPTIGRDREIESLTELARSGTRLITITGVGGVGKTRVATAVAGEMYDHFDEVRIVPLADVVDPLLVTATIATAIGAPVENMQSALDAVAEALADDQVMLVLDNLEQVVGSGPELAILLHRCPRLHLLITSRHVIRLRGEHEYPLAPLQVPDPVTVDDVNLVDDLRSEPAVALFVEHARAARPTFRLDATNAGAVAELCRRLDGLPLAIELVAARVRLLPPDTLLDRLGDRIDLPQIGSVDLPDRQRTLRATLDWSHRLLDAREQALLARVAVFAGGASLDALETICGGEAVGDVLETLASLLEKSLVVVSDDPLGGPRIAMLQTVRAYAWERLEGREELADTRDRHADWFLDLVLRCDPAHQPAATARWPELDRELPNVRAAIAWRAEHGDDAALSRFARSLWIWYWLTGRMSEGRAWIESLAPRLEPTGVVLDGEVAACFNEALGAVRFSLGDHDGAEVLLRRALDSYNACGDLGGSVVASCMLASIVSASGDISEGIELATAAVAGARAEGLDWGLAYTLAVLGGILHRHESPQRGRALQLEGLEAAREIGEPILVGHILNQIAVGSLSDGNLDRARADLVEAAAYWRQTRHMEGTVFCLEITAALEFADGRARSAAALIGAADAIRERLEISVWPVLKARRTELTTLLAETLGPDENSSALAEGRTSDPFALLPG
jgi:predicted ATPase